MPRLLAALLATLLVFVASPVCAEAQTLKYVDDVLDNVGGTVYVNGTPTGEKAQFWANGAWHDFSGLDPADKGSQDGPSKALGNGWYIYWSHEKWGGSYMVWRYPDGGTLSYSGSEWPGFKVRLNDVGYTSSGESVDSIIEFTSVYGWQYDGLPEPAWFSPFQISRVYGPLAASDTEGRTTIGVASTFVTTFVRSGTEDMISADNEVGMLYWDIDQPIRHSQGGGAAYDFGSDWREGIHLVDGYKDEVIIGKNTDLKVSDNNTWFRSGAEDNSNTPTSRSSIATTAGPRFTTEWRGEGASTGIGYDSRVALYPQWSRPAKTPPQQITDKGNIVTFDITQKLPYVADSNKADSIVLTDVLDPAFDAAGATLQVLKGGSDATDNWTFQISGQTLTATAKNTGHGYAEGEHVFRLSVPVSTTYDIAPYPTAEVNGKRYWVIQNEASVAINRDEKRTERVDVLVPYQATGEVQLQAKKNLRGRNLAADQFAFDLFDSAGNQVDSKYSNAAGDAIFNELRFTQDDIGKTFTYTIREYNGRANNYIYDTHVETVTVKIADGGGGRLNVVATYDADGPVFTNEYRSSIAVTKVSTEGNTPVPGATFTIYRDDGDGVYSDADQLAELYTDAHFATPIPTAEVITAEGTGQALIHGLVTGDTYWIKETQAPSGYRLDSTPYRLVVNTSGDILASDNNGALGKLPVKNGYATMTIANQPIPVLPNTAGPGITLWLFGGTALIVGAGAWVLLGRRFEELI